MIRLPSILASTAAVLLCAMPAAAWNDHDWTFKKSYLKAAGKTAALALMCAEAGLSGPPDGLVGEISNFLSAQGEPADEVRRWRSQVLVGNAAEVRRVFATLSDIDHKLICNFHMRENIKEFRAVAASEPEGERIVK